MLRSLVILVAVASAAVAAPVPKVKKADVAALTALQNLIAQRAEMGEWSKDDAAVLKDTLESLVAKVAEATGEPAWKLPVKLDTADIQFKTRGAEIDKPGVYLVNGNALVCCVSGSVVLATGEVTWLGMEDAVVVAKSVRVLATRNSLLVAAESVGDGTGDFGTVKNAGKECLVVAGKRIEAANVCGGYFHVLAPEFSDHPKAKPPVSAARVQGGAKLLAEPSDRPVGRKDFVLIELKAVIAK